LYPDANFNKDNFETIHAFTTIPHPTFDELNDPTDIDRPEPLTLRWVVQRRGTFVGTVFGSLHVDLRGWDVSGEQFRAMLDRHGIESVEYEGEGDSIDTFTERYHRSDDVVVVPHYDAVDLLDGLDLELSAIAETIERG